MNLVIRMHSNAFELSLKDNSNAYEFLKSNKLVSGYNQCFIDLVSHSSLVAEISQSFLVLLITLIAPWAQNNNVVYANL